MKRTGIGMAIGCLLLLSPLAVLAAGYGDSTGASFGSPPSQVGAPTSPTTLQNPLGVSSFCGLIKKLLQAALDIGIPVSVLFIVYAGFRFVLARGNPEALKEARQNFVWTLVGIAIFLGAWLLATVVANTINALQAGSGSSALISCQ